MALLFFSDVLKKAGLDPAQVKLIRHPMNNKEFAPFYEKNMVLEYTRHQAAGFSKGYNYWAVFIGDMGSYAKFFALYRVGDYVPDTPDIMPPGFPYPETFQGEYAFYDLDHVDSLREYEGRLIIDWGKSVRMWHQKGTTEKPIVAIQTDAKMVFSGFENLILRYDELKEIIENPTIYDSWHTALSSVNAIYLIVDTETGRQYIGSAYGEGGLLGRWSCYINTQHGNDKKLRVLICNYPERYHSFQFSILQILPKTVTAKDVIAVESLYKKKLMSIKFGMNDN